MRGILGLAGWQWLFLVLSLTLSLLASSNQVQIEGTFTIMIGIMFLTLFPKSPSDPTSLVGFRYFTPREAQILTYRVLRDDPSKAHAKSHVSRDELKRTLTNWKLIPHIVLTITGLAPTSTLAAYAPSLVASFGYDRLQSNALVSVGSWISIASNIACGMAAYVPFVPVHGFVSLR